MPSAATGKNEKQASSEAADNSPVKQIITIIEHKIRNLEKRKSKLTSYRDLQKAGKELNGDQKVAVAKYDEVAQTLEFARDLAKQVMVVATTADRDAKKQAKKDAWVRSASETNKIREVLLIQDCLMQMGNAEVREDFLNGSNGASKLTEEDLKILDDLYPLVTPKHEVNEEGQPGFPAGAAKAAEHLYAVIDGKPKDILGTTYTHIKEIVNTIHGCGYLDKSVEETVIIETEENCVTGVEVEIQEPVEEVIDHNVVPAYVPPTPLPVPPAAAVVPAPAYPLRPLPPITLQEVEHAYFSQQFAQQRPISEMIGSQNFYFLQDSELDSPVGTPQPPPIINQPSPPAPIPTQTFTNQHYVQIPGALVAEPGTLPMPPQPHFPPHPELAAFPTVPLAAALPAAQPPHAPVHGLAPVAPPATTAPPAAPAPPAPPAPSVSFGTQGTQQLPVEQQQANPQVEEFKPTTAAPVNDNDDWKESESPERDEGGDRKSQGQGDGQNRYRRYGRGGGGGGGGRPSNGYRGRGSFQNKPNDGYHNRHNSDYQGRPNKDVYQNRQYNDGYQRHNKDGYQNRGGNDGYYGNGDTGDSHQNENGGRDNQSYQGGYKGRGRGGPRGGARGAPRGRGAPPAPHAPHAAHTQQYSSRKQENAK